MNDWFKLLFGISEPDFTEIQNFFKISEENNQTILSVGDKSWTFGPFITPRIGQLRERHSKYNFQKSKLKISIVQGDVQTLHAKPENNYATFQVASQFNALEMIGPGGSPEYGITKYSMDRTQGPACCLTTGPAILYRNYFTNQTTKNQLNLLFDAQNYLEKKSDSSIFKNDLLIQPTPSPSNHCKYFKITSGYTIADTDNLIKILPDQINSDEFKSTIRIGIHEDIPVTATHWGKRIIQKTPQPKVTHVLSAAAAVAYNRGSDSIWKPLACSILLASYEGAILAAFENYQRNFHQGRTGSKKLFLTFVGGGVFGNRSEWIKTAIEEACLKYSCLDLEVYLVCYDKPDARLIKFIQDLNSKIQKNES